VIYGIGRRGLNKIQNQDILAGNMHAVFEFIKGKITNFDRLF
jgi:hypothetical protein